MIKHVTHQDYRTHVHRDDAEKQLNSELHLAFSNAANSHSLTSRLFITHPPSQKLEMQMPPSLSPSHPHFTTWLNDAKSAR